MIVITDQALRQFEAALLKEEASRHTISKYLRDVRKLQQFADSRITRYEQLLGFKQFLQQSGYAVRSINSVLSAINRFTAFRGHPQCDPRVTFSCFFKSWFAKKKQPRLLNMAVGGGADCCFDFGRYMKAEKCIAIVNKLLSY